jgi:uncharacterized alkaline shock family protein YloU
VAGASAAATGDVTAVDGTTEVLPSVVQKVVSLSAREIPGVVALGSGGSRAVGALRQTFTGGSENLAGVRVDLSDQQARIAMDVVIEYGAGTRELVRALRRHIPKAVEEIAGVPVVQLDIVVTDVHLPGEDIAEPGV